MAVTKGNDKKKRRLFYRVETINDKGGTIGGYVSALFYLFSQVLNVSPDKIDENLIKASIGSSPEFDKLFMMMRLLCDIPKPEEFIKNRENYCLYQKDTFMNDEI